MSDRPEGARLRAVPAGDGGAEGTAAAAQPDEGPSDGLTPPSGRAGSRFLSDAIVDLGFLPRERVDSAVEEGRTSGRTPEQVLVDRGLLTADQLARATAERFGLYYVDLTAYTPDLAALNLIDAPAARRFGAVPIGFTEDGAALVAMADPSNVLARDDLKMMIDRPLQLVVASPDDIASVVNRMGRLDEVVADAVEEESDHELGPALEIRESAEDGPVIRLVNSIIGQAVEEGASDIHFEPDRGGMRVRFRVDGVLRETTEIPQKRMVAGLISRVKIMGHLDIAERRVPQDGRTTLTVGDHAVDIRIVTLPGVHGEGLVMRLLDKEQALIGLDALGMPDASRAVFERGFTSAYGAVLATGPTGSGKSTTLYSALNAINSPERNIITIEDPVEYQVPGITQVQVNLKAGLSFATGLRSMLRADPDVILVGEIRDSETAQIAVEAALTGHLVLSTLHTNDAPSALTRLTEMGIEPFLTASALECVVAQRLVRKLCVYCKQRALVSSEALAAAGFPAEFDVEAWEPQGCGRCGGTGYKGRTGLYEVMAMSEEIRSMTIERTSADEIRRVAIEQGMLTVRDDGLEKVRCGTTSIAEVSRVT